MTRSGVLAAAMLALGGSTSVQLAPATLAAFERYAALTEARMAQEIAGASPFLWVDRQPPRDRERLLARLARGEIPTAPLRTLDGGREIDPEGGLIHHWIGTVFLPGATMTQAIGVVQDYERYPELFAPTIQRARVLTRAPDRFVVQMRTFMKKLVVTVVMDADYRVEYRRLGAGRVFSTSAMSNAYEVEGAGSPGERRHAVDVRDAYLWRLQTYCAFEARDGGVYEQCESISLTRGIPWMARWIVRPFVQGIPRETLEHTLGAVRRQFTGR